MAILKEETNEIVKLRVQLVSCPYIEMPDGTMDMYYQNDLFQYLGEIYFIDPKRTPIIFRTRFKSQPFQAGFFTQETWLKFEEEMKKRYKEDPVFTVNEYPTVKIISLEPSSP
jgi:hypothetical protein